MKVGREKMKKGLERWADVDGLAGDMTRRLGKRLSQGEEVRNNVTLAKSTFSSPGHCDRQPTSSLMAFRFSAHIA
jgi:hypothetical protein